MSASPQIIVDTRLYVGADPGSTGAVALLVNNRVQTFRIPLADNPIGGTRVDDAALFELARSIAALEPTAYVQEHVWGVRGQGASQFTFGDTNGALRMAFLAAGVRMARPVSSQRWTAALRVGSDKERHRQKALELWPDDAAEFTPRRGVLTLDQAKGNADAALIAEYGRRYNL